jgi:hypothetical protein
MPWLYLRFCARDSNKVSGETRLLSELCSRLPSLIWFVCTLCSRQLLIPSPNYSCGTSTNSLIGNSSSWSCLQSNSTPTITLLYFRILPQTYPRLETPNGYSCSLGSISYFITGDWEVTLEAVARSTSPGRKTVGTWWRKAWPGLGERRTPEYGEGLWNCGPGEAERYSCQIACESNESYMHGLLGINDVGSSEPRSEDVAPRLP